MVTAFEIRVLGELEVLHEGRTLALPASRKTRALLAYLAVSKRSWLRSRLCEIFWETPADPRAALRWSLNKLRSLSNTDGRIRLVTDRERVEIGLQPGELDLERLGEALACGVENAPTEALRRAADSFRGEFLEGLDLPDCPRFWEWCKGERESILSLRTRILGALVERAELDAEQCLRYARQRVTVDPYAEEGHVRVVRLLGALGRTKEALEQYDDCRRMLEQELRVGPSSDLERARAEITAAAGGARARGAGRAEPHPGPGAIGRGGPSEPRPATIGRTKERAELARLVEDTVTGRWRGVFLLEGEPGMGKTRLLGDLVDRVRAAGGNVLASRAFEAEMVRPYGVWIDALRAAPEASAPRDAELAALSPELSPESPAMLASQTQVFEAVRRHITRLAAAGAAAAVVVIDDLQWIDEPSAALLHYAARGLAAWPILFACAARRGELADNPAAQRLLRALHHEERLRLLELGPLDDAEVAQLARAVSPHADVSHVVAESAGNPLVAIEMATSSAGGGGAASGRVERLFLERLERLPGAARDMAMWAAAFGRPFTPELLVRAIGVTPGEAVSAVAELERRGVLRPQAAPALEYDFSHDLLRRCAYRQLSLPRRAMVHLHIARALAQVGQGTDAFAADVAHHAALGGDAELAARSCVVAGERCLRLFARGEAARLAYRGIEQLRGAPEGTRLRLHVALLKLAVLSGVGFHREREIDEELSAVVLEARSTGRAAEAAEALWLKSILHHESGDFTGAAASVVGAAAVASSTEDPSARARSLANAGRCLAQIEREMDRARTLLEEAAAIAARAGLVVAKIDWGLGIVRHFTGDLDDATARLGRALELARRDQDHWAECECLTRLAMIELERGRDGPALARCLELSAVAARMGEGSEGPAAAALEALARLVAGEPGANERVERALPPLRIVDAKGLLAYVLTFAALADLEAGRPLLARERATEALRAAQAVGRPSQIALAHAILAQSATAEGARPLAEAHIEAARRMAAAPLGVSAHARATITKITRERGS